MAIWKSIRKNLGHIQVLIYSLVALLQVELTQWLSSKHNMGMAFTRDVWQKIHSCATVFCQFDDYNWDWSLFHVSMTCLKAKLSVMLIKGPRVFHIGEW